MTEKSSDFDQLFEYEFPFKKREPLLFDGETITEITPPHFRPNLYRTHEEFMEDVFGGYL